MGNAPQPKGWRRLNWFKLSMIANAAVILFIIAGATGMAVVDASNTNPQFCATCHNMKSHVVSYLTSNNLDHVHALANVGCKDCHDYAIPQELQSGLKFITNDYDPAMPRRKFDQAMCLKCHISAEHVANSTDFLVRNPHLSHWPDLKCSSCHISHGPQIDYCGQCHDNGGQRMIGGPIVPRAENPWANPAAPRPDVSGH
jgi:cytochrome c nitrite reductase small subunit